MRHAALLLATAALFACGAPRSDPAAVVDAYFRALGADPMRTLPLLSERFHVSHGLRVVTAGEAAALRDGAGAARGDDAATSLDRRQLGWLGVQARPGYREAVRALRVEREPAREADGRADVVARVQGEGPAFELHFVLVREARGDGWRIDAIEPAGVVAENQLAAFLASPSERGRAALEQRLKRR